MTFPVSNIIQILRLRNQKASAGGGQTPTPAEQDPSKHRPSFLAAVFISLNRWSFYYVLTVLYYYTFPLEWAAELRPGWIAYVFLRNWLMMVILYEGWHWLLYEKLRHVMEPYKYNPKYPTETQNRRDRFLTTVGFFISSCYEVGMMHAFASGKVAYYSHFWEFPLYSLLQLYLVAYWRDLHFYLVHRFMHPWFDAKKHKHLAPLDFGRILYTWVHSLHHKSYNTGPWSGLSMHPIEHIIYYTCTLLPLFFVLHPIHFLANKLHADFAPLGGHDGHDEPGGGAYFHYLHHMHFECNYGTPVVPLDNLFGTFEDGSRYQKKKGTTE
ncbi:Fatty acid hydroxylase domain-containing protein [Balamuthia mandrillaris]